MSVVRDPGRRGTSAEVPTPLAKRLPVVAGLVVAVAVALVIGGAVWVRILVLAAIAVAWALLLGFGFGLPWSRILRYREPLSTTVDKDTADLRA